MSLRVHKGGVFLTVLLVVVVTAPGCVEDEPRPNVSTRQFPLNAYCTANVVGIGQVDTETDYLPHVVQCENGGAGFESLKAQAVAARTYLYYKMDTAGQIQDGTGDQVYTCGSTPSAAVIQAVQDTSGEVLTYAGSAICAFYVAGAQPSAADCVATASDPDPTNTERYVTYNWGLSGNNINQSTLGWVDPANTANRGCMSQWGSRCLHDHGWNHTDILKFYYGMDIGFEVAQGSCINPGECTPGETEQRPCTRCGNESRTCDGGGNWGSWGSCQNQGECDPDDLESQFCGECGIQHRTCGQDCTWGSFTACQPVDPEGEEARCDTGLPGICSEGQLHCVDAQLVCQGHVLPETELCDGLDNDCDDEVDEEMPGQMGSPPPALAARVTDMQYPDTLDGGQSAELTLVVENVGSAAWTAGQIGLAALGDGNGGGSVLYTAADWPSEQVAALVDQAVNPGETTTVVFTITAPSQGGTRVTETFWLADGGGTGARIACPVPGVEVDLTVGESLSVGPPGTVGDPPGLDETLRIRGGCSCKVAASAGGRPGAGPPVLLMLFAVLGLTVARRRFP